MATPSKPYNHADQVTETNLQAAVIELATWSKWLVHHSRPARTNDGWRTAIQGHVGFPDLIMARGPRLIVAELKRQGAKPTEAQQLWLDTISAGGGLEVYVWRPADWLAGEVAEILR